MGEEQLSPHDANAGRVYAIRAAASGRIRPRGGGRVRDADRRYLAHVLPRGLGVSKPVG